MAPFLRIAFNSYELGSLQAADEANPPFCAVKMKEALSTGRAAGWTPEKWQQPVLLGVRAQREVLAEGRGAGLVSPEPLRDPTFPHPHLPAPPSCGCRTAEATTCL